MQYNIASMENLEVIGTHNDQQANITIEQILKDKKFALVKVIWCVSTISEWRSAKLSANVHWTKVIYRGNDNLPTTTQMRMTWRC